MNGRDRAARKKNEEETRTYPTVHRSSPKTIPFFSPLALFVFFFLERRFYFLLFSRALLLVRSLNEFVT